MQIPDILRNRWTQTTAISIVAFAGGTALGYILGKRKNDRMSETITETTTEETTNISVLELIPKRPLLEDDPDLEQFEQQEADAKVTDVVDPEPVRIFVVQDDDWDNEAELASRHSDVPYVIHQEEFIEDEMGFRQETLTYYQGDDIMADASDTPIYNYLGLMGELKFGHGSKDPNVVYIRNEGIHMEWEVLLHQGHFAQEVMGLKLEEEAVEDLRHSVQKFRRD